MTSSVGMMICPNWSSRLNSIARWRIDSATNFSKPEYVWTTYQFLAILKTRSAEERLDLQEDPGKDGVHEIEVETEEEHGDDDDQGRAVDLIPGRPGHLSNLGPHLPQETEEALIPSDFLFHLLSFSKNPLRPELLPPLDGGNECVPAPLYGEGTRAGEAGLEPATCGFGDRCSSQLSYSPARFSFLWKGPFISILCERCACDRTDRTSSIPSFRSSSSCSAWWNNCGVCIRCNVGSRF